MSNLISKYEISVWDDVLVNGEFIEQRIFIIGAEDMEYQGKVLNPQFTRNANGEKKLTFQMYKWFIDNTTGEKIYNPFIDALVNERKVKLLYENKWYDFVVKNIIENSTDYLYSYELADALVQELSKNGFDIVFDAELMNNLGTVKELAEATLSDTTDWEVETDSFTELIEENLVYLLTTKDLVVQHIYADKDNNITEIKQETLLAQSKVLAFYSCCKNRPHRFQFIYLDSSKYNDYDKDLVPVNENRVITINDCQYYIDISIQESYQASSGGFLVPPGFAVFNTSIDELNTLVDTTISNWYRGNRFGFAQKTQYVPLLEKYCNIYHKANNGIVEVDENNEPVIYYGYLNAEFESPVFIENIITNNEFKGSTGWTGCYLGGTPNAKTAYAAKVASLYGRFVDGRMEKAEEAIEKGNFNSSDFESILEVTLPSKGLSEKSNLPFVINSGFYDNRAKISNVTPGEQWCLDLKICHKNGVDWTDAEINQKLNFEFKEVTFNSATGGHKLGDTWGELKYSDNRFFIEVPKDKAQVTAKEFQKKTIKLVISPTEQWTNSSEDEVFYIKYISLCKKVENEAGDIIAPGDLKLDGVVNRVYSFVKQSQVLKATEADGLKIENIPEKEMDFSKTIPVYNEGAQKVRTINIKESNYFNILQSIAEMFEAWLEIIALRGDDENPGRITKKRVAFRKYLGGDNHAAFRYGVNLQGIQRTFESKKIVTKLVVKANSNELATDGFCTIARAGSNPTGENNIYDFRYFHNMGMINPTGFVAQTYYEKNPYSGEIAQGKDVSPEDKNTNIQNFFNRIKNLNDKIIDNSEKLNGIKQELVKLEADKILQESTVQAAEEGIGETKDEFFALTGFYPEELDTNPFTSIRIQEKENKWGDLSTLNPSWPEERTNTSKIKITSSQEGGANGLNWKFNVELHDWNVSDFTTEEHLSYTVSTDNQEETDVTEFLQPVGKAKVTADSSAKTISVSTGPQDIGGVGIAPIVDKSQPGYSTDGYIKNYRYRISFDVTPIEPLPNMTLTEPIALYAMGFHCDSFKQVRFSVDGGKSFVDGNYVSFSPQRESTINVVFEGTYSKKYGDNYPYLVIQPNRGLKTQTTKQGNYKISNITIKRTDCALKIKESSFYLQPTFEFLRGDVAATFETQKIACKIPAYHFSGTGSLTLGLVDTSGSTISKLLTSYVEFQKQLQTSTDKLQGKNGLIAVVEKKEAEVKSYETTIKTLQEQKAELNKAFYSIYHRFIQEGTWISEDYVDDDKYYNDALSVMYNSCFPQVAYSINVVSIASLPGYEHFTFNLGDKTFAEDPEFFGEEGKVEVVVTELVDMLDDPSKSTVKVQNFKNQFQDLFQKITATVQQTQYNAGSYEKAAALADADVQIKGKFVTDALTSMSSKLAVAGQTTVIQDQNGITLTDSATKDEMRLIGGAIMMSVEDPESGERKWKTGLTPEGISATLVTAGTLNAGNIVIMNAEEPVFRWDAFGLSAFDIDWGKNGVSGITNPYKFVRFDKYGIYGINQEDTESTSADVVDGRNWRPMSIDDINNLATFALTWEGLKVTGDNGAVARIGKHSFLTPDESNGEKKQSRIISIAQQDGSETFTIDNSGNVSIKGHIEATSGTIGGMSIAKVLSASNPNLLKNSKEKITNNLYPTESYTLTKTPENGKEYTISLFAEPGPGVTHIGIYNSDGNHWLTEIPVEQGVNGYYSKTFKWLAGGANKQVCVYMVMRNGGTRPESSVELVKLEEGNTATNWTPAPEDSLNTTSVGNYSWDFNTNEGIIMKSGDTEVFKVGSIDGEPGLKIVGDIYANNGEIGGWSIKGSNLQAKIGKKEGYWDEFTASLGQDGLVLSKDKDHQTRLYCDGLAFEGLLTYTNSSGSDKTIGVILDIGSSGCSFTLLTSGDTTSISGFGLCNGSITEPENSSYFNLRVGDNESAHMQYLMGNWTVHNGNLYISNERGLYIGDTYLNESRLSSLLSLLDAG